MADPIITNVDMGSVILEGADYRDDTLVATGAGTIPEGTIYARATSGGKLIPFVVGGASGAGTPVTILGYNVVAAGAGDVAVRIPVNGKFRKERLIIAADGDDSNITEAIIDQLRDVGLTPINVADLSILDNQ